MCCSRLTEPKYEFLSLKCRRDKRSLKKLICFYMGENIAKNICFFIFQIKRIARKSLANNKFLLVCISNSSYYFNIAFLFKYFLVFSLLLLIFLFYFYLSYSQLALQAFKISMAVVEICSISLILLFLA